jgi:Zn-finger nucleic acid-binding protein
MNEKDRWKDVERGREEDYFLKKHREWLEKKRGGKGPQGETPSSEALTCPRCSKPLVARTLKQQTVHACPACGGGWLEANALKELAGL